MRTVLYYAPGSASFLVHWLLIEFDMDYELRRVDFDSNAQKSPEYLALNPNGVVPTLVVDGKPLHEAPALALWLAESRPEFEFAPGSDDPRRFQLLQWMFDLANEVQPLVRQWWFPDAVAGAEQREAVKTHSGKRMAAHWARIDAHLAEHGPFLLGAEPTLPDFFLVLLMRIGRKMESSALQFPHLAELAQRMTQRPSFKILYAREGLSEWP